MSYEQYRRKSARLECWDYSSGAWYYLTICTKNHVCHLGSVKGGRVLLSPIGIIGESYWRAIETIHPSVAVEDFVIMPNHIHGILAVERDLPVTIGQIINGYKGSVSKWCRNNGYSNFQWQPRYFDHIIRNEKDLHRIRLYIEYNPWRWDYERETPENAGGWL